MPIEKEGSPPLSTRTMRTIAFVANILPTQALYSVTLQCTVSSPTIRRQPTGCESAMSRQNYSTDKTSIFRLYRSKFLRRSGQQAEYHPASEADDKESLGMRESLDSNAGSDGVLVSSARSVAEFPDASLNLRMQRSERPRRDGHRHGEGIGITARRGASAHLRE